MAKEKKITEKLVLGLTPELKQFLQQQADKQCCEMNVIARKAILEYKERVEKQ